MTDLNVEPGVDLSAVEPQGIPLWGRCLEWKGGRMPDGEATYHCYLKREDGLWWRLHAHGKIVNKKFIPEGPVSYARSNEGDAEHHNWWII
jgi:hypothetical protein